MANLYLQKPNQEYASEIAYTTNKDSVVINGFFSGELDEIRVLIRGVYDPDVQDELISLGDNKTFTLPNLSLLKGLELVEGLNEIKVEGYFEGALLAETTANISYATIDDFNQEISPPTGLSVEQFTNSVEIKIEGLASANVIGYNLYCSEIEGGGVDGYRKINAQLITDSVTKENVSEYATLETDFLTQSADPLRFRLRGTQINSINEILSVDFDEAVPITEDISTLRAQFTLSTISTGKVFSFKHSRTATTTSIPSTIPSGRFSTTPITDPLFYVATAIYFNEITGVEVESSFSSEISAKPINLSTTLPSIPVVGRQQILESSVLAIHRNNPQASISPGSALRDTFLDPFASEAERLRFVVDYVYRSGSFSTLLAIDDPDFSGTSVSVGESTYKSLLREALFLTNSDKTQEVIDLSFEQLASNFGVTRRTGTRARGEVVFFTKTQPTADLIIPLGSVVSGGGVNFRTTGQGYIPLNGSASFYNPSTNRYEITIPISAQETGALGNLAIGVINTIVSPLKGLEVANLVETYGGLDLESNLSLAIRAQQAIASVDTGTTQGYYNLISNAPNVISASVVSAGDPLMFRDYDVEQGIHTGGKVDIWVQGEQDSYVTDSFAFTFEVKENVTFELVGDPSLLEFRATDNDLSASNPLVDMVDAQSRGLGLINATTGYYFDLTDVEITGYNTIKLSANVLQPDVDLTDIVLGDYRLRTGTAHTFTRQPVKEISTLIGEVSGAIRDTSYYLNHPNNILDLGNSTKSGDEIVIDDVRGEINTSTLTITDESHVILERYTEPLNKLGANPFTLRVFNADRTIEYNGPYSDLEPLDFTIIEGTTTTPYGIQRTEGSRISSGQNLLFDYEHSENFSVRYLTNLVLPTLQNMVDKSKHATADVLINEAVGVSLNINAVVVLTPSSSSNFVDSAIRTNLSAVVGSLRMGDPLRVSDVVNIIDNTTGVSYVQMPLTKMTLSAGSQIVREAVSVGIGGATLMSALSTNLVNVWLLDDPLNYMPEENGGVEGSYRGVFRGPIKMSLASDISLLGASQDQAYIIGAGGASIKGFTDDATLNPDGTLGAVQVGSLRISATAGKLLISLPVGWNPSRYEYGVTYTIGEESSVAQDISVPETQYLTLGSVNLTYEQDQIRSRISLSGVR